MTKALTPAEVETIMERYGYSMKWRSGDNTAMGFAKQQDNITLHCRIEHNPNEASHWQMRINHTPGAQMLIALTLDTIQFPHPKFQRFERSMFRFAQACATVAENAAST